MKIAPARRELLVLAGCSLLALVIGVIDWLTGEQYDLFIFYFIPIALAAWIAGQGPGVAMALISAVVWPVFDVLSHQEPSLAVETWDEVMRLTAFLTLAVMLSRIKSTLTRERQLTQRLSEAMTEIKQLQGIIPMCSFCRKIRDEGEKWVPLEKYLAEHSNAKVSHGLCPACYKKHYGELEGT